MRLMMNTNQTLAKSAPPLRANRPSDVFLSYAKCRIDPMNSKDMVGIPDTDSTRKIVVDYRTYADCTVSLAGTIQVATFPILGSGTTAIRVLGTGSVLINNSLGATLLGASSYTSGLNDFTPLCIAPEWVAYNQIFPSSISANVPFSTPTPFASSGSGYTGAAKARLVSCATKIMYTGQALNCAGTISSSNYPVGCDYTPGFNPEAITSHAPVSSSAVPITANLVISDTINGSSNLSNYNPDTCTLLTAEGCLSMLSHSGSTYAWREVQPQSVVLVQGPATATSNAIFRTVGNSPGSNYANPGVAFYDFDWTVNVATLTNLVAGTSFRVESYSCFEINLTADSPYYRLAKENTMGNDLIVQRISQAAKQLPTALPANSSLQRFVNSAISAARIGYDVGKFIAPIFI